ncbi:MAG: tetratricopeptide repeat protein [Planctomycetota bacterium]
MKLSAKLLVCLLLLTPWFVDGGEPVVKLLQSPYWLVLGMIVTLLLLLIRGIWLGPGVWDRWAGLLLVFYVFVLSISFYRSSTWLAHVAFCVAAAIAGNALQPSRRTQFLLVLPAVVAGLPPFLERPLHQSLNETLVQLTSTVAGMLEIWHYREGSLLTTLTAGVDLEPALNSPLGIPGLVVLLWGWMIYRRQPSSQMLVAIPLAAAAGVVMQAGTCLLFLRDLTDGGLLLSAVLWFALLMLTLLLLYSATQMAELLTHAITPPDHRFQNHIEDNACVQLWDRCVSGRVDRNSVPIRIFSAETSRLAPTVRPIEFLKEWFFSRRPRLMLRSAPMPLALIALLVTNGTLSTRQSSTIALYTAQMESAQARAELDLQEICLRGLAALEPANVQWRLQLAAFLWEHRGKDIGWKEYERLAEMPGDGGAAAHLWIARNALSPTPQHALADDEIIRHLQRSLNAREYSAESHALLSRLYSRNNEPTLAGQHIRSAADAEIKYLDELITFHRQNNLPMAAEERIPKRIRELQSVLEQQPENTSARQDLASLLEAVGDHRQAMLIVNEGRRLQDSTELQETSAALLLSAVRQEISSAAVGGDQSLLAVREALQLNPRNEDAPRLAALLRLEGAEFDGSIDDALLHWRGQVREAGTALAIRNLALLAFAAGEPEESLQAFANLEQLTVEDSRVRIAALMQLGNQADALAAATKAAEPLLTGKTAVARLAAADLLSRAAAFTQAAESLNVPDAIGDEIRLLRFGRARVALDELDRLMAYPGFYPTQQSAWTPQLTDESADKVATLLETALESSELTLRTADRLCLLMFQGGKLQAVAERALTHFRSTRGIPAVLFMALGSRALQAGKYDDAIAWLEQAQQTAPRKDPGLLNNLALALVRGGREERYLEALELANSAVRLFPENHILLATRGEVYLALRQTKPALADLESARQLRPDYPETLLLLAKTCSEMGRREEAEKYQKMAETLQQGSP